MPDKAPLLVFGTPTPRIAERISAAFKPVLFNDQPEGWLEANGAGFEYAASVFHAAFGEAQLARLPNLKLLSSYGVGYDNIDAGACAARGVIVTHTPDVLNAEVATTAILLMMACYRELLRDDAFLRAGKWEQGGAPLTRSMDNQKVGILGLGRIGLEIARKLEPWGTEILYHSRSAKDAPYRYCPSLVEMAAEVDVLIVITPGGAATKHLVNAEVMAALGPKGTLINVARGSVVDEQAAIDALQSGKLGWAGLDVFEDEPRVPEALRALPNAVLLPHVGSATVETRDAMSDLVVDNLLDHLNQGTVRTPVPECADLVTGRS